MTSPILVAEDDADERRLLVALLRENDISPDEAADGLEAINLLRGHPHDVVVIDLMMPRLDGYVVLRYLEEQQPHTRAIVTSGVRSQELEEVARSPVVRAVFHKPFDARQVVDAVRAAMGDRLSSRA
jgi:CheY-like chemotaxis protein